MPDTIYLLYDPDDFWQQYDTRAAAEDAFDITVSGMTQDAIDDGEWHDDIETVALYRADRIRGVRMVQTGHADERGEAMEIEEIDDPPPADAALLASANRELVEQLQEANGHVQRLSTSLAILREKHDADAANLREELGAVRERYCVETRRLQRARDEETTRAHAAELHRNDVVERLRLMEERAEKAERERDRLRTLLASPGVRAIAEKRAKHAAKGWTSEHDAGHGLGDLAVVGAACAIKHTDARIDDPHDRGDDFWGLERRHGYGLDLIAIGGALIAAEYDRLEAATRAAKETADAR